MTAKHKVKTTRKMSILGKKITIKIVQSKLLPDAFGEYYPDKQLILLRDDLSKDQQMLYLLHEIFHATVERIGLFDPSDLSPAIEHVLINSFSSVVTELFDLRFKK